MSFGTILDYTYNRNQGVKLTILSMGFLTGDKEGHTFRISIVDKKGDVDLSGASVTGWFIPNDQGLIDDLSVPLKGSVDGNKAILSLPAEAYLEVGRFNLVIKLNFDGDISTIFWGTGNVSRSRTDSQIDVGNVIPSLEDLLAQIEKIESAIATAKQAASEANESATKANASARKADESSATANASAAKADTSALNANSAVENVNAAVLKIDGMTVSAEKADKADAAISEVNGVKHIAFKLPKGDTGATPDIQFHVSTGAAGTDVLLEQSGTAEEPVINLTIPRGDTGAVDGVDYFEGTPKALGTAASGTSNGLSRGDHVHPMPSAEDVGARPNTWLPSKTDIKTMILGTWDGNTTPNDIPFGISYVAVGNLTDGHGFPVGFATVFALKDSVHRLFQLLVEKDNGRMYIRSAADGTNWGPWKKYLAADDTAANASKLGGRTPGFYMQMTNLLDNSYWKEPSRIINQRGQTSYTTSGYSIDRWTNTSGMSVNILDGYLRLENTSESRKGFAQKIEPGKILSGKPYTFAVCTADGRVYMLSVAAPISAEGSTVASAKAYIEDRAEIVFVVSRADMDGDDIAESELYSLIINVNAGKTLDLVWAAIYEGEYTADSLPQYVPKSQTSELLECLRYFWKVGRVGGTGYVYSASTAYVILTTPVYMRIAPSAKASSDLTFTVRTDGKKYTLTELGSNLIRQENQLRISMIATDSGLSANQSLNVLKDSGTLEFSADL